MSGRGALEDRVKSKSVYQKARGKVERGDPDEAADTLGGQLGKTRDAIRRRNQQEEDVELVARPARSVGQRRIRWAEDAG